MKIKRKPSSLTKKARRGFRGYPAATVAFYGPDDTKATKLVVGIIREEGAEPDVIEKWFSYDRDLRLNEPILKEVLEFIREHGVMTIATMDRIIGCPHEEGIDYPDGATCPECPFWAGINRWTGDPLNESKLIH